MSSSPNILVLMADQLPPHFLGAYGHPVVRTPHIDELSSGGVRFDAAYCNSPLCAPSRFSFMSGQLVSRIAAYDNASEFFATIPTFAHYLRSLGYRTCLSGKMHFVGPDQKHGFEDRVTTDIYPSDFAWTPDWELPDERIDKWYHNMRTVRESGVARATFQIDYDDEVCFAARRWLFDYARDKASDSNDIPKNPKNPKKPFLLVSSFIHPHDPYVARPEWWDLYSDSEIPLPSYVPALSEQDSFSRRIMDGIEASVESLTDEEIIRARRAYFANVSYFDDKVGELVRTLDEIGELDNTVIIVTSDHGDMLGERGLWYKMNFFEHSARVPLIMSGADIKSGSIVSNVCSLVDLLPTFVELGGGDVSTLGVPIDGESLVSLLGGGSSSRDEAIGEYCAEMTPYPVFMIRRGRYKYIHCDADPPQLYDLESDPMEKENLASSSSHTEVASNFASEVLSRWDSSKLREDIISTQRARRLLYESMSSGGESSGSESWDYNPPRDASNEYVRNHMDWTLAAERYRYPPLKRDDT